MYADDILLISFTCSDLRRMTKMCEDEMKWLDMCFKMAVLANQDIPCLIISRLETKRTTPDSGNSIMAGNKFRSARHRFSFIVTICCFSFNNIGCFFIITIRSHFVKFNKLFYSNLGYYITVCIKNDVTKMIVVKHAAPISLNGEVDFGSTYHKKCIIIKTQ